MTLRELQLGIETPDHELPGTVIVGEVVRLRSALVAAAADGSDGFDEAIAACGGSRTAASNQGTGR